LWLGTTGSQHIKKFRAKVSATDADNQVKCYQQLINRVNGVTVSFFQGSFGQLVLDDLSNIDLLVGADICYSSANAKSWSIFFITI
jgi:hypothetical protein